MKTPDGKTEYHRYEFDNGKVDIKPFRALAKEMKGVANMKVERYGTHGKRIWFNYIVPIDEDAFSSYDEARRYIKSQQQARAGTTG